MVKSDLFLRDDFSIFKKHPELVYLDSTATTQKPRQVIDQMHDFIANDNATVHRGVYNLSQSATIRCEDVRKKVKTFINAKRPEEIIFVKGATEAINLVSHSYAKDKLAQGDEILITQMEHHANIVPWQQLMPDVVIKVCKIDEKGELDLADFKAKCTAKTKLVAFTHVSNVLGTINPVKRLVEIVRQNTEAVVLIDGAQAVSHFAVDVQDIDCDFYCFSGHKLYGPTGIGVLYGKYELLASMRPYQTGGDMIEFVRFEGTTYAKPPARFEAGTPAIIEIIGLGAAVDYVMSIGFDRLLLHEQELHSLLQKGLDTISGLSIYGTSKEKLGVVSFTLEGVHSHDVGTVMDQENIAIRVGHHCAQPLMQFLNVAATARISIGCYNTHDDIEKCVGALKKVVEYFR